MIGFECGVSGCEEYRSYKYMVGLTVVSVGVRNIDLIST